jgi:conflict system STAND superfamily ATPase/TIR domain-containing protein
MADIFISHSSRDNAAAAAIGERIRRERPTWSLFYDRDNIHAGQKWQQRLREELQSSRVFLAVLSRDWLLSPWCFAEAVMAAFHGKDFVGIEVEDLSPVDLDRAPPIVHERQRVRMRDGDARGWQEVLESLDRSGLDPDNWFPIPPKVGRYPGLVAFDEKDAGVFFGRKQEITGYLAALDTLCAHGRS